MVLAESAVFFGHRQGQETVLTQELQVAAREDQLVVEPLGVGSQLRLAEFDQRGAEFFLAVGEHPIGVPLVPQAPEGVRTPHLVGHPYLRRGSSGLT